MTSEERLKFIAELIASVASDIEENVPKMPETWDGHELRRYIADKFEQSAMTVGRKGEYGRPYVRRYREYKNEVLVRNL